MKPKPKRNHYGVYVSLQGNKKLKEFLESKVPYGYSEAGYVRQLISLDYCKFNRRSKNDSKS